MTAVDPPGSTTVGRYRLVQRLGEGGMGVVHLGVDPDGHAAAVKILRAHIAADPQARRRLEREVHTLRRLRHPRIAEVLDAELTGDVPYLVTQFVPGTTLDQLVRDEGPLDLDDTLDLGRGLAEALEVIHAAGIVHRDLKPANVMMVDNEPVVIDFGIAHLVDESRITMTGLVIGTPGYLSPESVEGTEITEATDWWGWAATIAYAATGRPPFGGGPTDVVLDRVLRGQADIDGVPEPLGSLLASVLTVELPDRRTGAQIRQWLGSTAEGDPLDAATVRLPAPNRPVMDRTVSSAPPERDPSEEPTVRFPAPADAGTPSDVGAERTIRTPPPAADPAVTSIDNTSAAPTLAFPAQAPVAVPGPESLPEQVSWPSARPSRRNDLERPIIVPPKPYSAPPDAPGGLAPAGPLPGQDPAEGEPDVPRGPGNRLLGPVRPTGTLLLAALAVMGTASVAPGGVVVVLFVVMVLARTVDRSATLLWRRRSTAGPRPGDIPIAVVSLPWQATLSAVASLLSLVLPLLIAVSVAFIVGTVVSPDVVSGPSSPVSLAVAAFAGVLAAWWGPGGGAFRRGSRTTARWSISNTAGRILTWSLLVLVAVSSVLVAAQGEPADWAPFPSPGAVLLLDR